MDTSLQGANLTTAESRSLEASQEDIEEQEHHVHLPNPSLWPLILGASILLAIIGLLFIPENPWLLVVAAPLILIGILGWGLEDPMATPESETDISKIPVYDPHLTPQDVLERARETLDNTVTISSTAYSTHPVKVDIDQVKELGVVLALYGKVELEAQRENLENALRQLPNVLDVRNFVVAEDEILNIANARLESLSSKGKLDGASNIRVLVENYILHLYGDVPNRDMRLMLERELIGIPGVRVVVNHIGLNKDIPGNLGKTRNKI